MIKGTFFKDLFTSNWQRINPCDFKDKKNITYISNQTMCKMSCF